MFGEMAILDDGRRVVTPFGQPGLYIGDAHFPDLPQMRMPDAATDLRGVVWISAGSQTDLGVFVIRFDGRDVSLVRLPIGKYGTRTIVRALNDHCEVAFTTNAKTWTRYRVMDGGLAQALDTGAVPGGGGGMGMRCWSIDGTPLPLEPLDVMVNGKRVRAAVYCAGVTIGCSLIPEASDQVLIARGDKIGTLRPQGIDWPTPRISPNGRFWCGVRYSPPAMFYGSVPATVPPLMVQPAPTPTPTPTPTPVPVPMPIPNHLDVVKAARAKYDSMPAGVERAYYIVNQVAWMLREEGAGLFKKDSGTRYAGVSIDVIIYKSGYAFDVLGDAEGDARPQWGPTGPDGAAGTADVTKWVPATNPGGVEPPPPPPPPPTTDLEKAVVDLSRRIDALTKVVEQVASQNTALGGAVLGVKNQVIALDMKVSSAKFPNYAGSVPLLGTITLKPQV